MFWKIFCLFLCCSSLLQAAPFVYVLNRDSDDVSVVDLATNTVVATIPVGDNPDNITIPPDGSNLAYVTDDDGLISIIDLASNTVIGTISDLVDPYELITTFNGLTAYITDFVNDEIVVMDLPSKTVLANIPTEAGPPRFLVLTPDEKKLYVSVGNGLSIFDTQTNTLIKTIDFGNISYDNMITPDGQKVYVIGFNTGIVWVIDTNTDTLIKTIVTPGSNLFTGAVTPDGTTVFVVELGPPEIYLIDTATDTVTGAILIPEPKSGISFSLDGTQAYVGLRDNDELAIIDLASQTVTHQISVGSAPIRNTFSPLLITGSGTLEKNIFLTQTDIIASTTWTTFPSARITEYRIFGDRELTNLLGVVDGSASEIDIHNFSSGSTLYVQAVNEATPIGLGTIEPQ